LIFFWTLAGRLSDVESWVAKQLGYDLGFAGNHAAMGFGNPLVAGVVFHNWQPSAGVIELSAAATSRVWLTKERLRDIFGYVFDRVGCQLAVARIAEGNGVARRIARRVGADEYRLPRLRGLNEAEIIATLTVEAWREFERKM
jgi:RimJ/RimL family protein N-acetyltransferase